MEPLLLLLLCTQVVLQRMSVQTLGDLLFGIECLRTANTAKDHCAHALTLTFCCACVTNITAVKFDMSKPEAASSYCAVHGLLMPLWVSVTHRRQQSLYSTVAGSSFRPQHVTFHRPIITVNCDMLQPEAALCCTWHADVCHISKQLVTRVTCSSADSIGYCRVAVAV
jgi:hypothetical protein